MVGTAIQKKAVRQCRCRNGLKRLTRKPCFGAVSANFATRLDGAAIRPSLSPAAGTVKRAGKVAVERRMLVFERRFGARFTAVLVNGRFAFVFAFVVAFLPLVLVLVVAGRPFRLFVTLPVRRFVLAFVFARLTPLACVFPVRGRLAPRLLR